MATMSDRLYSQSQWEAVFKSICRGSATGITVYHTLMRTTQVIVHEENFDEYPVRDVPACDQESYPRYFHLKKGYRVILFALVQVAEVYGPFLMMEIENELPDDENQVVFFGTPLLLETAELGWISFIPTAYNRPILRKQTENLSCFATPEIPDPAAWIKENGSLLQLSERPPALTAVSVPGIPFLEPIDIFETVASLSNVKSLRIQHQNCNTVFGPEPYCAGLCIYYMDGSVGTLGQWDGSLTVDSKVIYDSAVDGPLDSLAFQYGEVSEKSSYIMDIVNTSSNPKNLDLKRDELFTGLQFYRGASSGD